MQIQADISRSSQAERRGCRWMKGKIRGEETALWRTKGHQKMTEEDQRRESSGEKESDRKKRVSDVKRDRAREKNQRQ